MEPALYEDFARLEDTHWWFRGRRAVVRSVLERFVEPLAERRVLDVGCGTGGMLPLLADFGQVQAIDASPQALRHARERAGPTAVLSQGQLPDGLPPGERFGLVTAFDVLEHVPDALGALRAVRAALVPGGQLVVTVPAYQFLWSPHDVANHHYRRYTRALLEGQLRQSGFALEHCSYFNSLLFPAVAATRLARRLVSEDEPGSEISETPGPLNRALEALFAAERLLVPRLRLPFGVSLIAVARAA